MPPTYTAGTILAAAEALASGRETYTAAEVACLLHLAFESGRTAAFDEDQAELLTCWERADTGQRRATYEDRVSARLAEMEHAAEIRRLRAGLPPRQVYTGGPIQWPEPAPEAMPATVTELPTAGRRLRLVRETGGAA